MLREAKIIVPEFDSDHNSLEGVRNQVALKLQKLFGGVIITKAEGRWLDPATDKVCVETVFLFIVACDPDSTKVYAELRSIAWFVISTARQEAVYVTFPDGSVEIITK